MSETKNNEVELKKKIAELEKVVKEQQELIDEVNNPITIETIEQYVRENKWNPDHPIKVKDLIEIVDRIKYPERWDV